MVELTLRQDQIAQAFLWAERGRARSILELWSSLPDIDAEIVTTAELIDRLDGQTTLLEFSTVDGRLVCWVFKKGEYRFVGLEIKVSDLEETSESFLRALQHRAHSKALHSSRRLYEALVTPIGLDLDTTQRLILVLPSQLAGLPFSALFDPHSNSYLIERVAIATAPSATLFLLADERARTLETHPTILIAESPKPVGGQSHLSHLPYAALEAETIAALLPGSRRLRGTEATPSRVLDLLPAHTAFHFSGHGLTSFGDSDAAALVLTPEDSGDSLLRLEDIFSRVLNGELTHLRLVTLSACDTLVGLASGRDGSLSLGQSFFAAGVPRVVGTLWKVSDRDAAELMTAFYRNLRNHRDAAEALREGILEQLDAGGPHSEPASWAAFAVIGG